ncbi:sigma-70 family RNA polymerase sigma factor [Qipengyuania sphaerica]|uniref:sigma-70 family RNA polymerase sigma factor n=1 Tax=Qipengyuania sphaerica TaxID=2867243 RepID=UPI001C8A6240|nr:sigma-70 family RNA polymerase sigma factor [Qipengyuania sphaerica]MBX7542074.1 sigma-70 family RNA polymerase sigma factor [Qipengyuania sphaerica]
MIADEASMARMMAAAQNGDRAVYRVLLAEAQLWLERFFAKRVPPAQRDDLVQEVLLAVHNKRASWDPSRPFFPWLAAIARYRWVDHLRKVYRSAEDELGDHDAAQDSEEEVVMARMSLERLFVHLPEKQVEAIELVKIEGLSIAEASARTGQSESLVKVNIHRGLKKLSALVEKAD